MTHQGHVLNSSAVLTSHRKGGNLKEIKQTRKTGHSEALKHFLLNLFSRDPSRPNWLSKKRRENIPIERESDVARVGAKLQKTDGK